MSNPSIVHDRMGVCSRYEKACRWRWLEGCSRLALGPRGRPGARVATLAFGCKMDIEVLMKLTRASSYAIHAVVYLASRRSTSLVGSRDIARPLGITENLLVRILKPLVSARILWSLRGPGGGYRLARPASRISVLDVIEGVGGPVRGVVPPLAQPGQERVDRRLEVICEQAAEWTRSLLAKIPISDLLEKSGRGLRVALPIHPPAEDQRLLPPEVAEGLERIRKLMAARDGGQASGGSDGSDNG